MFPFSLTLAWGCYSELKSVRAMMADYMKYYKTVLLGRPEWEGSDIVPLRIYQRKRLDSSPVSVGRPSESTNNADDRARPPPLCG